MLKENSRSHHQATGHPEPTRMTQGSIRTPRSPMRAVDDADYVLGRGICAKSSNEELQVLNYRTLSAAVVGALRRWTFGSACRARSAAVARDCRGDGRGERWRLQTEAQPGGP